jgi:hypothetical protein
LNIIINVEEEPENNDATTKDEDLLPIIHEIQRDAISGREGQNLYRIAYSNGDTYEGIDTQYLQVKHKEVLRKGAVCTYIQTEKSTKVYSRMI